MKRKIVIIGISVMVISMLVVGTVLAFTMGNVDGVWEYVEDNTDPNSNAFCVTYGTGPGTSETARSRNDPSIQTPPNTDENQVHYGKGSGVSGDCPTTSIGVTSTWFDAQSGLGFDGNNNIGINLVADTDYLIGRLTHYNRPIYLTNDGSTPPDWAFMKWIDIDVTISGILCGNGQPPNEGSTRTFTYRVQFDETPNNADPCPYTPNNYLGCSDAVIVGSAPPSVSFTCDDVNEPAESTGVYTVTLSGFVDNGSSTTCPASPGGAYQNQYITLEGTTNNACLYGKITDFEPTSVTLKDFIAEVVEGGVVLSWETTSEVNTLGFNLYRAEAVNGDRVKVNQGLIFSQLAAGSLDGASYSFNDGEDLAAGTYYYWLEEVEQDGTTDLFGPAEAVID